MDDRKCWHPSFFSWRNSAILCVGENNQKGAFSMCEDFNIFLLKLPEDCKEITTESCVQFHLPRKHHVCPICGSQHTYVHSYRSQNLCGLPTDTVYIYRKRRYRCQKCGKAFFEENSFIERFQRIPRSEIDNIIKEHSELVPSALIARRHGISTNTVMRYFERVMNCVDYTLLYK